MGRTSRSRSSRGTKSQAPWKREADRRSRPSTTRQAGGTPPPSPPGSAELSATTFWTFLPRSGTPTWQPAARLLGLKAAGAWSRPSFSESGASRRRSSVGPRAASRWRCRGSPGRALVGDGRTIVVGAACSFGQDRPTGCTVKCGRALDADNSYRFVQNVLGESRVLRRRLSDRSTA